MKTIRARVGQGYIKVADAHPGKPCFVCGKPEQTGLRYVLFQSGTEGRRTFIRICDDCLLSLFTMHQTILNTKPEGDTDREPTLVDSVPGLVDTGEDDSQLRFLRTGTDPNRRLSGVGPIQRPERRDRLRRRGKP